MPDALLKSPMLRSRLLADHGVHGIFSLRNGGISPPPFDSLNLAEDTGDTTHNARHNLHTLLQAAGMADEPHRARQVHGREVLPCSGQGTQHEVQADILQSGDGSPVGVRVADCTPVLLADPERGLVAAVHAGWRGTAALAVAHAVQALCAAGARPGALLASIGPCIGSCCFEIGDDTAATLAACCPGAGEHVMEGPGKPVADLVAINRLQLLQAGLDAALIETATTLLPEDAGSACTCCNPALFFSYRRDGKASGRHLAIVAPMAHA